VAKPRFVKVDLKRGVVEKAAGPRGATVLDQKDKLVFFNEKGFLRKVPSTFKGPVGAEFSPLLLAKREAEVAQRKFLLVFENAGEVRAVVLKGEDLVKVTSKGKILLPENSRVLHFDEKELTLNFKSKRKKPVQLSLSSVKEGKPGAKGNKVANTEDLSL
jgi:hypothetical protein